MNKEDKEYLCFLKKYVLVIAVIFIISVITGALASMIYPGVSAQYFGDFEASFGWIKDLNPLAIILLIFLTLCHQLLN